MGAWIEIVLGVTDRNAHTVAPLVGAWIEINLYGYAYGCGCVAPLVGAWIEIIISKAMKKADEGRSSRGSVD